MRGLSSLEFNSGRVRANPNRIRFQPKTVKMPDIKTLSV